MSNIDESFRGFMQQFVDHTITLDDVCSLVKELFPSGKTDQLFYAFAVFQKA